MAAVMLCSCFTLGTVLMSATSSTRLSCTATWVHFKCLLAYAAPCPQHPVITSEAAAASGVGIRGKKRPAKSRRSHRKVNAVTRSIDEMSYLKPV